MDKNIKVVIETGRERKGRQLYLLLEPLTYKYRDWKITVPVDFETDLVSLPALLRIFASPTGRWAYAAIFHDYLYRSSLSDRKTADLVFNQIMKESLVPKYKRILAYIAVRIFGYFPYARSLKTSSNR